MENLPAKISNMDIINVLHRLRDFRFGIAKSASADQPDGFTVQADMTRLNDRLSDLETLWGFKCASPCGDHPKTQGLIYHEVEDLEDLTIPENSDIQYIMNYIEMFYFELANSQSNALVTGLQIYDQERGIFYIDRLKAYVTDYLKPATPNDYPDATPEEGLVGAGRLRE